MQQQEIDQLINKYLNGTATAQEEEKLLQWYREQNQKAVEWVAEIPDEEDLVKKRVLSKLGEQIQDEVGVTTGRNKIYGFLAAASAVIIISISLYFWNKPSETLPLSKVKNERFKNDIPHGGNKAILTIAGSSQIVLDDAGKGIVSQQGDVTINKEKDGLVTYALNDQEASTPQIHTISTPKGGQYQVVLSDGTRVWLNAGSSLQFPSVFTGKQRVVTLSGEAYFEVAKNKNLPFKVSVNKMEIEVLGTHFNVMAYEDESNTTTTLLEGSVGVNSEFRNVVLKPGQRANLNKRTAMVNVSTADTEEVMAWKNGYFMFSNEAIESVMRKISRWYDVDVIYQSDVSHKALWGTISRFQNVSEVLSMLEMTGVVHFKIEGRRIIVMP
jgi:transmembrane sensor